MKCLLLIVVAVFIATSSFGADTLPVDSTEVIDSTMAVQFDSLAGDSLPTDTVMAVDTVLFSPGQTLVGYRSVTDSINLEQKLGQRPNRNRLGSAFLASDQHSTYFGVNGI